MKKRVAIQGYQGAFHQEAVESYWPQGAELVECATFEQLVQSVVKGKAHYGVMAVENSLVGCILPNFLLIRESGLSVIGEVYLRITQNLMALPGVYPQAEMAMQGSSVESSKTQNHEC